MLKISLVGCHTDMSGEWFLMLWRILLPVGGESRIVPQLLSCNGNDPEYEGTMILQNISNHLPAGTV